MSGPKQRHPRQEVYPRLRQGSSYVWKLEPGTQHLTCCPKTATLCLSGISILTFGMGGAFKGVCQADKR